MTNIMTKSEAGKLGSIASRATQRRQKQERIQIYLKNPTSCKYCSTQFLYEKRMNKFCASSCSAKYNNDRTNHNKKRGIYAKQKYCINCNAPVANKMCDQTCQGEYKWKQNKKKVIEGNGTSATVKRYLLEEHGNKCNKCKNVEWNGIPIAIEIEHIDGNSDNNSLDNVELLCPNCHAQTPTYKAKNKGKGRYKRRMRYHSGLSY